MLEVLRAAEELERFCAAQDWRSCLIGGLAVQRWGEPRETIDVDLTLLTGFGGETPFIRALLGQFEARIEEAAAFALQRLSLSDRRDAAHLLGGGSAGHEGVRRPPQGLA